MPDASAAATERVLAGRYRLIRSIGGAGVAEVWEAHDEVLARPVAVKILRPGADPQFAAHFREAAVRAAGLGHPNLVSIFDTGTDGDASFVVMELVRGTTLADQLRRDGALSPVRAAHVAIQVAEALDHAHRRGIAHGSVTAANVLLTPDGRPKLTDAGLAAAAGAVDPAADVHALGVLLYTTLCGRGPGQSPILPPRQVRAGIPRPLEAVVLRALAESGGFGTVGELRSALLSVDLGEDDAVPIVARERTPPEGIIPSFRQSERTWLVPTAIIVAVALALGLAGLLFSRTQVGRDLLHSSPGTATSAGTVPLRIASAAGFDPAGDGDEHNADAPKAIDGDPATVWTTQTYTSPSFGNLKSGVGLVLRLDRPTSLARLKVTSSSRAWAAFVYVAGQTAATIAGWGTPVAKQTGIDGSATFDLRGQSGGAVLLWITNLGAADRVEVAEAQLTR